MALNGTTMGDAVAIAVAGVASGITPGTPVTPDQLKAVWEAACTALVGRVQSDAVANPGTFANGAGPVSGLGTIS